MPFSKSDQFGLAVLVFLKSPLLELFAFWKETLVVVSAMTTRQNRLLC